MSLVHVGNTYNPKLDRIQSIYLFQKGKLQPFLLSSLDIPQKIMRNAGSLCVNKHTLSGDFS